jgi:hypothetical protein
MVAALRERARESEREQWGDIGGETRRIGSAENQLGAMFESEGG